MVAQDRGREGGERYGGLNGYVSLWMLWLWLLPAMSVSDGCSWPPPLVLGSLSFRPLLPNDPAHSPSPSTCTRSSPSNCRLDRQAGGDRGESVLIVAVTDELPYTVHLIAAPAVNKPPAHALAFQPNPTTHPFELTLSLSDLSSSSSPVPSWLVVPLLPLSIALRCWPRSRTS